MKRASIVAFIIVTSLASTAQAADGLVRVQGEVGLVDGDPGVSTVSGGVMTGALLFRLSPSLQVGPALSIAAYKNSDPPLLKDPSTPIIQTAELVTAGPLLRFEVDRIRIDTMLSVGWGRIEKQELSDLYATQQGPTYRGEVSVGYVVWDAEALNVEAFIGFAIIDGLVPISLGVGFAF